MKHQAYDLALKQHAVRDYKNYIKHPTTIIIDDGSPDNPRDTKLERMHMMKMYGPHSNGHANPINHHQFRIRKFIYEFTNLGVPPQNSSMHTCVGASHLQSS